MKNFKLNMAKSNLSVGYTQNDNDFVKLWEEKQVFKAVNESLSGKPFLLLDGPPYANGNAHMGHALNKLLKDLVVKSRWFMGQPVLYRPGWDCHGLPLELAVEKKHGKLDEEKLKKYCKLLAFKSLVKQRKSFKRLGVLGEWNNPYVTLSKEMVNSSLKTLKTLFDKGLLEYKQYPVHYCPACASALAEAELETKPLLKDSLFFKFELENGLNALVWTTTPWTLPMNQGLAFNKNFEYEVWNNNESSVVFQNSNKNELLNWLKENNYVFLEVKKGSDLNLNFAVSPLTREVVKVMHADFVEDGETGFVHVSCAHGPEDYNLGKENGVQPKTYLNKNGVYENMPEKLMELEGKKLTQVKNEVLNKLKEHNLFVLHSESEQDVNVCWRHKCQVYYNATWQVFMKLDDENYNLKERVKVLLAQSDLSEKYKERLTQMLLGRGAWCLSRQRKWGCKMNLLVDKNTNKLSNLSSQYLELLTSEKLNEADNLLKNNDNLFVFDDVLDVWFDSGNVANADFEKNKLDVDLVLEGKDQFRGWFQSLLWLTVATENKLPYKNLFCHGFVLDEMKNKLEKSKGNAASVESYADLYGSDVLHLWVASQDGESDPVFSVSKLEEMKRLYSRLRLTLRFLTSNLYDYDYQSHKLNLSKFYKQEEFDLSKFMFNQVGELHKVFEENFKLLNFKKPLENLYLFCDKVLSGFYFDVVKNTLYLRKKDDEKRLLVQTTCYELLLSVFDFVKVYCPFVAEEFYQDFFKDKSVFELNYFTKEKMALLNQKSLSDWNLVMQKRKDVLAKLEPLQQEKLVKSKTEVGVTLNLNNKEYDLYNYVEKYFNLSDLMGVSEVWTKFNDLNSVELTDLKHVSEYKKCPRCWNYNKFLNDLCEKCVNDES